jgi:bacterioferritin
MLRLWKKELEEQSMDEMNHAKILANRIIQLGGTPTTKLTETPTCSFSPPPEDRADLVHVIELVLEGERCVIEKYNRLLIKYSKIYLLMKLAMRKTGKTFYLD